MTGAILGLPVWFLIVLGAVILYLIYRWRKNKAKLKYTPPIAHLPDLDFRSPRDNPPN